MRKILVCHFDVWFARFEKIKSIEFTHGENINISMINNGSFDCVFPIEYRDYIFIDNHRDKLTPKFLVSSGNVITMLEDKMQFVDFMNSSGFGEFIPKTFDGIQEGCLIKPRVGQNGSGLEFNPSDVDTEQFLIQEIIKGKTEYSTHVLFFDGRIQHQITYSDTYDIDIFNRGEHGKFVHKLLPKSSFVDSITTHIFEEILQQMGFVGVCNFNCSFPLSCDTQLLII
jgi:hypothetical protein